MRQVQIGQDLFVDLYKLIVLGIDDDEIYSRAYKGLEDKFQRIINRDLYTKYKTAETEEEREKARQAYLDKIGVHKDFRWGKSESAL